MIPDASPNRSKMIEMLDEGILDPTRLAVDLLNWLSEDDIKPFCNANDIDINFLHPGESDDD